ncbi:MAG: LysR substrate-binding domain-containing protein [Neomegalonema sp.]|nr:LysR substrate-binding domain-containing protein [Neomegalonema sp.]
MFDPELLRAFVEIADCRSFTRAAERLHRSQTTVSAQLRRLEERAGHPLIRRSTRSVAVTPEGEALLGYARGILRLQEAAMRQLSASDTLEGVVRLGVTEDFTHGGLVEALARFRGANPKTRLEVEIGASRSLVARLDRGGLDLVLGKRSPGDQRGEFLWCEPLCWAAAPGYEIASSGPLSIAVFAEPCVFREGAIKALCDAGWSYELAFVSPSFASLIAAARAGLAAAPTPRSLIPPDLAILATAPPLPPGEYALYVPESDVRSAAAMELADALRAVRLGAAPA